MNDLYVTNDEHDYDESDGQMNEVNVVKADGDSLVVDAGIFHKRIVHRQTVDDILY
jgi:ribosomal protein S1